MTEPVDKNCRVLVADPDVQTCSMVLRTLGDHGHKVTSCHDAKEAWRHIQTGCWDLVVLDLGLPDTDGFDILTRCRQSLDLEELPIVVLSDTDDDDICDRALALGASAFITKPLRIPLLSHTVWQIIRSRARDLELRRLRKLLGVEVTTKAELVRDLGADG